MPPNQRVEELPILSKQNLTNERLSNGIASRIAVIRKDGKKRKKVRQEKISPRLTRGVQR
jgi:hypothetical protein